MTYTIDQCIAENERLSAELAALKGENERLKAKNEWAMGLNACLEHERAEWLTVELAALKAQSCETCRDVSAPHHDFTGAEYRTCVQPFHPCLDRVLPDGFTCSEWAARDAQP